MIVGTSTNATKCYSGHIMMSNTERLDDLEADFLQLTRSVVVIQAQMDRLLEILEKLVTAALESTDE